MTPKLRPRLVLGRVHHDVHLDTCRLVRSNPPGYDARFNDVSSRDIALAVVDLDLRPCKTCKPLRALAWWEHQQHKRTGAAL